MPTAKTSGTASAGILVRLNQVSVPQAFSSTSLELLSDITRFEILRGQIEDVRSP